MSPIFLYKLHHCVLDDIQRRFMISYGEHGLLEGAPFDTGKKSGKFGTGSRNCLHPK